MMLNADDIERVVKLKELMKMQLKWSRLFSLDYESIKKYTLKNAGVYILWIKQVNGDKRAFYVGQAKDLEARLFSHVSDGEPNKGIKEHVTKHVCLYQTAEVATQNDRDGIETFLFNHYKPECNDVAPPGIKPIDVNLP